MVAVMDLQKEREAFEAWFKSLNENGRTTYFLGQESKVSWEAWQAAKAQAVQECAWLQNEDGYFDTSCSQSFVFSEPDDRPHASQFTYCCFCGGKLIEAQEPDND